MGWEQTASGYAAVWAKENTRESLFDAMQRREVYGTTGPRMTVRFFGGWDYAADGCQGRHCRSRLRQGRADGRRSQGGGRGQVADVPGRGDEGSGRRQSRSRSRSSKAGWMPTAALQEKVYDVVWSGDRKPGADGKLPPVGNTVDVANATWTNTIGSPELVADVAGPGLRSGAARVLLRPRARDPDAALDRVRRQALQGEDGRQGADDDAGARLHVADLVHAGELNSMGGLRPHGIVSCSPDSTILAGMADLDHPDQVPAGGRAGGEV